MRKRNQRPTAPPSVDGGPYAHDAARIGSGPGAEAQPDDDLAGRAAVPPSEVRRVTRRTPLAFSDEEWARSMAGAPYLAVPPDQLKRLPLDHRAAYLISRMDGDAIDLETLVEVSALGRAETLRLVRALFESGVIDFS
jgi:hypothetical protein